MKRSETRGVRGRAATARDKQPSGGFIHCHVADYLNSIKKNNNFVRQNIRLELRGIEPRASRMRSERSTI